MLEIEQADVETVLSVASSLVDTFRLTQNQALKIFESVTDKAKRSKLLVAFGDEPPTLGNIT